MKVDHGMQFDCCFGGTKRCPIEQGQAQIYGGGIHRIDHRVEIANIQWIARIQRTRLPNQRLREIGKEVPVASFVCIGQCRTLHWCAEAHVVELLGLRRQTDLDIAQAFPILQLRKGHRTKLFGTVEGTCAPISPVTLDDALKCRPWQEIHQLSEQGLANVHGRCSGRKAREQSEIGILRSSRHHPKSAEKYIIESICYCRAIHRQSDTSEIDHIHVIEPKVVS